MISTYHELKKTCPVQYKKLNVHRTEERNIHVFNYSDHKKSEDKYLLRSSLNLETKQTQAKDKNNGN